MSASLRIAASDHSMSVASSNDLLTPTTDNTSEVDAADTDDFATPSFEATDPLLSKARSRTAEDVTGLRADGQNARLDVPGARRTLKKSTSELGLGVRRCRHGSTSSVLTAIHIGDPTDNHPDNRPQTPRNASLQAPYHTLQRSSSNSGVELRSRYHDPTIDSATLQEELVKHIKHKGQSPSRPWRVRRVRTAKSSFCWTNPTSPRPGFMWFPVRSKSDPASTSQVSSRHPKHGKNIPLKSSMKRKSKSAAATPSSGTATGSGTPDELQPLRRVKTVDFEDNIKKALLQLPPLKPWTSEPHTGSTTRDPLTRRLLEESNRKHSRVKKIRSCPGPTFKSCVAEPAITRTDVHVVAIAPSWGQGNTTEEGGIPPATPTMQIVESKNGCYEVVWDDVPAESDVRLHRRRSSASEALYSIGSTAARGLERVNSKLTEWTWGQRELEQFQPQIVVFPEDESQILRPECAVDDDEDVIILAPPNSERNSAGPSRFPSGIASPHPSRSLSADDADTGSTNTAADSQIERDTIQEVAATLLVPDPEAPSKLFRITGRGIREAPDVRRFSNMEDSQMKFRGHRDSLTIARSRILNAGGVSPELFMHRDSVSMAKKRMHMRNHAVSGARAIPRPQPQVTASEPLTPVDDFTFSARSPLLPVVKGQAAKGINSNSSASMLRPQSPFPDRHIQIVE